MASFGSHGCPLIPGKEQIQTRVIRYQNTRVRISKHVCLEINSRGGVLYSISTGRQWSEDESKHHINYLESLACFLTLRAFCLDIQNSHLKAMIDNTTTISYINSIGGQSVYAMELTGNYGYGVLTQNTIFG